MSAVKSKLLVKNISTRSVAFEIDLGPSRSFGSLLAPGASVDISNFCLIGELSRAASFQRLIASNILEILATSPDAGVSISRQVLQTTASPYHVNFADISALNQPTSIYCVSLGGEGVAYVRQSTMTTTGFDILGGSIGDTHHLTISGGNLNVS